ncbi:tRNA (adenosine(37)-N6)-threonylcarbamoyltransferase complex dimerization subunit type 1 TsaB [Hirschia litorea]|uniref:N(6)-L-threonylcarbamoyladenine synthase n=1 Tax=Hirschia litorea TaxID=1199156 RepID=A0ABW2INE2_9PROT
MKILALSTVGNACEAGIWSDDEVLAHVCEPMAKGHDTRLPLCAKQALSQANMAFSDIDRIAVIAGPGSFTGVRVGVAFARGLGVALDVPVVGISSLEAALPKDMVGRVVVALPARRRAPDFSWWAQVFVDGQRAGEPIEADVATMQSLIGAADSVCGQGLEPVGEFLSTGVELGLQRAVEWALETEVESLERADPQYVRAPDAVPMKPKTDQASS